MLARVLAIMVITLGCANTQRAGPSTVHADAADAATTDAGAAGPAEIRLRVGETALIHLPFPASRVPIDGVNIYDMKLIGTTELQVTGYQPGRSTLTVWGSTNELVSFPLVVESLDAG